MLKTIIIIIKRLLGIKWGIDIYASNFARKFMFKGFESKEVVTKNYSIIKKVFVLHPMRRMIGLLRIFQQNPRLQSRTVFFSDPGQFQFLLF